MTHPTLARSGQGQQQPHAPRPRPASAGNWQQGGSRASQQPAGGSAGVRALALAALASVLSADAATACAFSQG